MAPPADKTRYAFASCKGVYFTLHTVNGYAWAWADVAKTRPVVFVRIKGVMVPFYRSSKGSGGAKKSGSWNPFFGIVPMYHWLVKGDFSQVSTMYGSKRLIAAASWLNRTHNWDHQLDLSSTPLPASEWGLPMPHDELIKVVNGWTSMEVDLSSAANPDALFALHVEKYLKRINEAERVRKAKPPPARSGCLS